MQESVVIREDRGKAMMVIDYEKFVWMLSIVKEKLGV